MTYIPKIVKCRLKTGGKSIEEIRDRHKGQGMTYRDFESIQKSNEQFDGVTLLLSLWDYDGGKDYHLHNWEEGDDEKVMMGLYHAEQVHPFPGYKNDLDKFVADWKAGEYDPGCPFVFSPEDVEEIEVVSEEVKQPPPSPAPQRKHKKRKRRK